jgi:hypothetical protein
MARTIIYWICTALLCLALFGSLTYLTGSAEVVAGFAKAGYPQHLRIVLGIAKPVAAIVLPAYGACVTTLIFRLPLSPKPRASTVVLSDLSITHG